MSSSESLDQVIKSQDVTNSLISIKKTIRLSCTASSPQYLVLGANTGSLYFFERHSFRFLQLCIFEELQEPISMISFSADEKLLSFATAPPHRNIYITPVPIKGRRKKDLLCISEHKAEIKCLNWAVQKVVNNNKDGSVGATSYATILFSADDSGIVCKTHFAASLLSAFGSSSAASNLSVTTDVLYQADSRVNQLSFETELNQLIVSSSTCTALLDFSKGQAFKVGTKPRTGPFGSSFFIHVGVASSNASGGSGVQQQPQSPSQSLSSSQGAQSSSSQSSSQNSLSILAARPGNRVWVAQPSNPAKVAQTLNFQSSLQSTPPSSLFPTWLPKLETMAPPSKDDLNFHRLIPLAQIALLTWNQNAVFFVDIHSLKIITWYFLGHKGHGYIADVATTHSHTYVLYHKYESISSESGSVGAVGSSGISNSDLQSGNFTIAPLLAHLHVDWNALLAWCIQALDWPRTSFILQHYAIDNLPLLQSIGPFMTKQAVDGNTANEIGRLASFQMDRIINASSSSPVPNTSSSSSSHHTPIKSYGKEGKEVTTSASSVTSTSSSTASSTDWSSFSELPDTSSNKIHIDSSPTSCLTSKATKSENDSSSPLSESIAPSSLVSLDRPSSETVDTISTSSETHTSPSKTSPTELNENRGAAPSTPSDQANLQIHRSTLIVEDPFDFGSSTAPFQGENTSNAVSGDLTPLAETPAMTPDLTPRIAPTSPVSIQDPHTGSNGAKGEGESGISGNPDLSDSALSYPDSPTSSLPSGEIFEASSSPPQVVSVDDSVGAAINISTSSASMSSSSIDLTTGGSSTASAPNSGVATARRKKRPRAVDIASPSAKLPNAVQLTGASKLPASVPVTVMTVSNAPPQIGSALVRSGSGATLSNSTSSLPLYDTPVLSSSPLVVPPASSSLKDTSNLSESGIRASSSQISSSANASPSTTPSSSVNSSVTTPIGSLTQSNSAVPPEVHTATQWGPASAIPSDPSLLPNNAPTTTPNPSISPIPQSPVNPTPTLATPLHSTSAPLVGGQSPPPTPQTTTTHGLASSMSAIPQPSTVGDVEKPVSATKPEPSPSSAKQPLNTSGTQSKASTKDELKQLGRDFKNKAKEGFRSFLSALPSPTAPSTTQIVGPASVGSQETHSNPALATQTLNTSHSDVPEYVPPTTVQSDPITAHTIEQLQLYRVLSQGREAMTEATIYPRLKQWIFHFHSHLESLPNAAHHALVTDLLTACFEFEVSSPKHEQPAEWEEKHALDFQALYLPSLRLSKVLTVSNAQEWSHLIQTIIDRLNTAYEHWKQGKTENVADETSNSEHEPESNPTSFEIKGTILSYCNDRAEIDAHLEKGEFNLALKKAVSKSDLALIFTFLPSFYSTIPKETLIACAQQYPTILPHNVEKLVYGLKEISEDSQQPKIRQNLLTYFTSLMEKHETCRHDEKLSSQWLDLILESQLKPHQSKLFRSITKSKTYHLKQLEGIHSENDGEMSVEILPGCMPLLESDTFNHVWLALKDDAYFTFDRSEAFKICLKNGYFRGALMLAFELDCLDDVLEISIACDDKYAIEKLLSYPGAISARVWPYILIRASFMHALFDEAMERDSGSCLQLTPGYLVSKMSHDIGPSETVSILTGDLIGLLGGSMSLSESVNEVWDRFVSSLPFDVFQQLLLDGKRGEKRKAVIARALKSFDQSMYAKRNAFFGPQISNVEFIEKASVGSRDHPLDHVPFFQKVETAKGVDWTPTFTSSSTVTPTFTTTPTLSSSTVLGEALGHNTMTMATATPSFLGDHGNHWGVHSHFSAASTCLRCGLPLLDPRAGKVAFFDRCAHAYHDTCVEEDACPECLHASFHTLLPPSFLISKHI